MATPRFLCLSLFLQLLAVNYSSQSKQIISSLAILARDLNNDEVTKLRTKKNYGSLSTTFTVNHAYSYTGVSNVVKADWLWTLLPKKVLCRASKCFHHFKSRDDVQIRIQISNNVSVFETTLHVIFKSVTVYPSKYAFDQFADNIAIFNDGPKTGKTVNFLVFWYSNSYIMMLQSKSIELSAIIKPFLEHPAPYQLWRRFPQQLWKKCNESSLSNPLNYVKQWKKDTFEKVISWTAKQVNYQYFCVVEFNHKFAFPSYSVVDFTAEFEETSILVGTQVCIVEDNACPPPVVRIKHGFSTTFLSPFDAPELVYVPSEEINLQASILGSTCLRDKHTLEMSWHVIPHAKYPNLRFPVSEKLLNDIGKTVEYYGFPNPTVKSSTLQCPAYSLPKGEYVVVCSITVQKFCGPSSLFAADYLNLRIIYPLLRPVIGGGKYKVWQIRGRSSRRYVVDASKSFETYHPSDVVNVLWFCHQPDQTISFKTYFNSIEQNLLRGTPPGVKTFVGCFGRGFLLQNSTASHSSSRKIALSERDVLQSSGVYIFTILAVRKRTEETAIAQQIIRIKNSSPKGRNRIIRVYGEVVCLKNCDKHLQADEVLSLSINCRVCGKTALNIFPNIKPKWYLQKPGDGPDKKILGHPSVTEAGLYGSINVRPTALEDEGEYVLTVEYSSTSFFIISIAPNKYTFRIPTRPTPGYCSVRPAAGLALVTRFKLKCFGVKAVGVSLHIYTIMAEKKRIYEPGVRTNRPNLPDKNQEVIHNGTNEIFPALYLPVGNKNTGFRLLIRVLVTTGYKDATFTTTEATVVPPNKRDAQGILERTLLGSSSELSLAIRRKNIYKAIGIITSAISIVDESPDDYNTIAWSTEIIRNLKSVLPKAGIDTTVKVTATVAQISQMWTRKKTLSSGDDLNGMIKAIKDLLVSVEYSLRRILPLRDLEKYEKRIETASLYSLRVITNAVKFISDLTSGGTVQQQTELLEDRQTFLAVLAKIRRSERSKIFAVGDYEVLEIARIAKGDVQNEVLSINIGITGQEAGATIDTDDPSSLSSLVAVSTFYFNPYPTNLRGVAASDSFINVPVVGISVISDTPASLDFVGRPGIPSRQRLRMNCSVLMPLKDVQNKSQDIMDTKRVASIFLPPPCGGGSEPQTAANVPDFVPQSAVQANCGPIQLEADMSAVFKNINSRKRSLLTNILGAEESLAYLVLKPSGKCRFQLKPCLRVSFAKLVNSSDCKDKTTEACTIGYKILYSITLPRQVSTVFAKSFRDDVWSIPLTKTVLDAIQTQRKSTISLVEDLQADPLAETRTGTEKYRRIKVNAVSANCYSWSEGSLTWAKQLCGAGKLVAGGKLNCKCTIPTEESKGTKTKKPPFLLGGSMIAIPNYINFEDALSLLLKLTSNPYIAPTIIFLWIAFIPFLLWSERRDREDAATPLIHIPVDSDPQHTFMYEVVVFTSIFNNSGTTANVSIALEGEKGVKTVPHVISDESGRLLQRGSIDTFMITSQEPLGKVVTVRLWHDNTGSSPSWCVDRVAVYDMQSDLEETNSCFVSNTWLSLDFFPFLCQAELNVSTMDEIGSTENMWRRNFFYQVQNENIWTSMFNKTTGSTFTRIQRVACLMVSVFGCMLATMMFYDLSDDLSFKLTLGQVSLSYAALVIGTEAALLMAPVNFFVDYVFRNLKPANISPKSASNLVIRKTRERLHSMLDKRSEMSYSRSRLVPKPSGVSRSALNKKTKPRSSTGNCSYIWNNQRNQRNRESDSSCSCQVNLSEIDSSGDEFCDNSSVDLHSVQTECSDVIIDLSQVRKIVEILNQQSRRSAGVAGNFSLIRKLSNLQKGSIGEASTIHLSKEALTEDDIDEVVLCKTTSFTFPPTAQCDVAALRAQKDMEAVPRLSTAARPIKLKRIYKNKDYLYDNRKSPLLTRDSRTSDENLSLYKDSLSNLPTLKAFQPLSVIRPTSRYPNTVSVKSSTSKPLQDLSGSLEFFEDFTHYMAVPGCYLPKFFRWIAWIAIVMHLISSSFFTLLYGLQFGQEKYLDWLLTFFSSMIQNMFLITPLRMVIIAAFETYACPARFDLNDWVGIRGSLPREDAVLTWRETQRDHSRAIVEDRNFTSTQTSVFFDPPTEVVRWSLISQREREIDKRPWCYKMPEFSRLRKAGKLKIAVEQVKRFWLEAISWVLMVGLVTTILILHRDPRLPRLYHRFKENFVGDFMEIRKPADYLTYMEDSFVPTIFQETETSSDDTFRVLGAVRIRQLRVNPISCPSTIPKRLQRKRCRITEGNVNSFSKYDTGNYQPFWRQSTFNQAQYQQDLNGNENLVDRIPNPWQYTDFSDVDTPLLGNSLRRNYYPPGGYVVDLRNAKDDMIAVINGMRNTWWVSNGTAAIFTDFTLYSKYSHHVTSLFLAVEVLAEGSTNMYYEINSFKPPYLYSMVDIVVVGFQLLHIIINIFLVADFIRQCREVKWRRLAVYRIIVHGWNMLTIIIIVLSMTSYTMYFIYIAVSMKALNSYKKDTEGFTSFSIPARQEKRYLFTLSLTAFLSYIRVLKIFRSSKIVTVMMDTLYTARHELFNIGLTVAVFLFAFGHAGIIAFGGTKDVFQNLGSSYLGLFNLISGSDIAHDPASVPYNPLWSVMYVGFLLLNIILIVNLFSVVTDETYTEMRKFHEVRNWDPVETLAVLWLYEKILMVCGITTTGYSQKFLRNRSKAIKSPSNFTLHSTGGNDLGDEIGHHGQGVMTKRESVVQEERGTITDRSKSRQNNQRVSMKSVYVDSR